MMNEDVRNKLRELPSIDALLAEEEVRGWVEVTPRALVVAALRAVVDRTRQALREGTLAEAPSAAELVATAEEELTRRAMPSLRRVINATGVVLHTGLGRAPLCDAALEAVAETACGYCNLEFDLESGGRGRRVSHVASLLREVTGAEAATVVNNNAAATLLILSALACGREVVVSRGQLIEIGGSFRLPDIMAASGAVLREVGTTNRTRIEDYRSAIGPDTALLLHVHTSNYRVVGFTEETALHEIAALAHARGLIAVDDLGSGAVFDLSAYGLPKEPCVRDSIVEGADLVCFSGDKLLGGPQCGIIAGRADLVQRLEAHPLARAVRVGKLTLAALEATLRHDLDDAEAVEHVPALAMLAANRTTLAKRAHDLSQKLEAAVPGERFTVTADTAYAGGGSLPAAAIDTMVVQWRPTFASAEAMVKLLRDADVPVIARIRADAVCFDLRTLSARDLDDLVESVSAAVLDATEEDGGTGDAIVSLPII